MKEPKTYAEKMKSFADNSSSNSQAQLMQKAGERHSMVLCRSCGSRVTWFFNEVREKSAPTNLDGTDHKCVVKVKVYTPEEIAAYKENRWPK